MFKPASNKALIYVGIAQKDLNLKQIFVQQQIKKGDKVLIGNEDSHHILRVLRKKQGDYIEVSSSDGMLGKGKILFKNEDGKIILEIMEIVEKEKESPPLRIHLVQSILKGKKTEFVIQKTTEIGVHAIYPLFSYRSIIKFKDAIIEKKKNRWKKIAGEASKQCGRLYIPEINILKSVEDCICVFKDFENKILLFEEEGKTKLFEYLKGFKNPPSQIVVAVGCEGSWTKNEFETFKSNGFIPVNLGPFILRSETASISVIACIRFYFD